MTDVLRQLSATVLELSAEGPYVLPLPPPPASHVPSPDPTRSRRTDGPTALTHLQSLPCPPLPSPLRRSRQTPLPPQSQPSPTPTCPECSTPSSKAVCRSATSTPTHQTSTLTPTPNHPTTTSLTVATLRRRTISWTGSRTMGTILVDEGSRVGREGEVGMRRMRRRSFILRR